MDIKIKQIIDIFLQNWIHKEEVEVIFICGSYVTGNPSKHSDIDVHIVTNNSIHTRVRGNKIINGVLVEYFVNPLCQVESYFKEEYNSNTQNTAHMIHTGNIYYQKNSSIAQELKLRAQETLNLKFKELNTIQIEIMKYSLWDGFDNLQEAYQREEKSFELSFYTFIYSNLYVTYAKFLRLPIISSERVERYLTQESYRDKYLVQEFTDSYFREEYLTLISKNIEMSSKMKVLEDLVKYVLEEMGGFEVDGWRIESELDLK
ncbi:MAG: nucleotidyltransferase domain-containing protein [Nanoarchaeota archaeon]|nr:nucleotidyltransferase domain-containing protein [Nanoarchaeota archaeon]